MQYNMYLKLISVVTILLPLSQCANILAVLPTPSYSHQIAYSPLWKELSLRGHKVTVITTDPLNDPKLTNLTEINVGFSYKYYRDLSKTAENKMTMWNVYEIFERLAREVSEAQLKYPLVQDLIHNKTEFDVVLVEVLYPEFLAFAEIYKCPKIIFSSMDASAHIHGVLGNPSHPTLYPDIVVPFYGSLNFKERLTSALFSWYRLYYYYRYSCTIPDKENFVLKYFNVTLGLDEMMSDVDMMFINVNPVIQGSRAAGPTTINIGGPRNDQTELPKELAEFLDGAKNGFIYFSLGSNVKSKELNDETRKSIIESLREMPYKVLWKFEADDLPEKPDNIKLIKWAPQQSILAHPNIKLFITQGGLQSMEEAIYSAGPLVVIPFFGDQEKNAKLIVSKGIGKIVDRQPFVNKRDLKDAMLEVINNPSYKNSANRLKQLALDTPMTGLERAVWWTEYVIRNKGAKQLRNPAADIPFYQYYLIDVISFLLLVAVLVLSVIIVLVKILFKILYKLVAINNSSEKKLQ